MKQILGPSPLLIPGSGWRDHLFPPNAAGGDPFSAENDLFLRSKAELPKRRRPRRKIMAKYTEYDHLLDDGKTVYDEHGNRHEVYESDQLLGGGKNIYIDGKKYQTYDHFLDDGKTVVRPDGSSYDMYTSDHILDDGKTVYADGKTYDLYSGTGIFGDQYTYVNQRGGSRGSSRGTGYGSSGGGSSYDYSIPSGAYYGPVSIPKERISIVHEIMILLFLPAMAVLGGGLGGEAFLILFAVFLLAWSGTVLSGLHSGWCEFLPSLAAALIIGKLLLVFNALQNTAYRSDHPAAGTILFFVLLVILELFLTEETEEFVPGFFIGALYAGALLAAGYMSASAGDKVRLTANLIVEGGFVLCLAASALSLLFKEKKNLAGDVFDRKHALKLLSAGCIPPLLVDLLYAVTGKAVPRLLLAGLLLVSYLIIAIVMQKVSYYDSLYRFWILVPLALLLALAMISKLPAEAVPDAFISSAFLHFISDNPLTGFMTRGLIRCSTGVGNLAESILNPLFKGRYPDISNIFYGIWLYAAARCICSTALKFKK